MNNLFVPFEQALHLKELGFNQECFGYYTLSEVRDYKNNGLDIRNEIVLNTLNGYRKYDDGSQTSAPLYQQAFEWFREQTITQLVVNENGDMLHGMLTLLPLVHLNCYEIQVINAATSYFTEYKTGENIPFYSAAKHTYHAYAPTYEAGQLACLKKLIEVAKTK